MRCLIILLSIGVCRSVSRLKVVRLRLLMRIIGLRRVVIVVIPIRSLMIGRGGGLEWTLLCWECLW